MSSEAMTDKATLIALAERVEKAEAGSRELEPVVGSKVKFETERQRYTIQARNDRFVILTKPFNAQRTYLYTIADLKRGVRGACDLIFGTPFDLDTPEGALSALKMIEEGDMGVSNRNCIHLSPNEKGALTLRAIAENI